MPKARFIVVAAIILLAIAAAFVVWRGGSDATRDPATTPAIAPASASPSPAPAPAPLADRPPEVKPPPRQPTAPPTARGEAVAAPAAPKFPPPPADVVASVAKLDEAVVMVRLREAAQSDPELAIQLARAANLRFPDTALAPERHSIIIHALAGQGKPGKARGEAEYAVNHYPDGPWVREIEAFTGAHRHRNLRVNDAGVLEPY
jgi:hypothetical protein